MLLGLANDLFNPVLDPQVIAVTLLSQFLRSDKAFLNALDRLTGRFLLVASNRHTTRAYQDACGMRNVFYSTEERVLASHLELLVENLKAVPTRQDHLLAYLKQYTSYYLPGNLTPYRRIYWLTPNTALDLDTLSVSRFFPRQPLVKQETEAIVDQVTALLTKQAAFMARRYRSLVSLTEGRDTRTTLALIRDVRDQARFFTYFKSQDLGQDVMNVYGLQLDRDWAVDIAQNLRLNHTLIDVDYAQQNSADYRAFATVMARNTYQHHNFYLAWQYLHLLPPNHLHILSMHHAVPKRGFYHNTPIQDPMTPEMMAYCYHRDAADNPDITALFARYADHTQLDEIMNWNPYDIFYWEYRMGVWGPSVVLESDPAFETFCLFNNRWLLHRMFQLPESYLEDKSLHGDIVKRRWPILTYWPMSNLGAPNQFPTVEGLSMADVTVVGQSDDRGRLNVFRSSTEDAIVFNLRINPPLKGDRAVFTKPLQTKPGQGYLLTFEAISPYERPRNKGRMRYTIMLGEQLICSEDVANWGKTNLVQILFEADQAITPLMIEVKAQRDCEKWHWGKAARLFVRHVHLQETAYHGEVCASCSSPFSDLAAPAFSREDLV